MGRRFKATGKPFVGAIAVFVVMMCGVLPAAAQDDQKTQPNSSQSDNTANSTTQQPNENENGNGNKKELANPKTGTSDDRLFYALPNFLTVSNKTLPPLTRGQKFKAVARGAFDWVEYPWYGALAGISQAENSEPGYGQGAEGYGKRYGAAFADGTIENFMTGAVLPSIFKQDPRFYQEDYGTFWRKTGYAVSRIFVTRTDSGGEQFNYSEIIGSALSAGISTYSYHPKADHTLPNTMSVWGSQVGYDTLTIVVKEFWPDIKRAVSHKQQRQPPAD